MDRIKKILAPTDLSELSQAGVRYALHLAKLLGAEVTAYHVVGSTELAQHREGPAEREVADLTLWQTDRIVKSYQLALARFLNEHFSDLIPWLRIREKVEVGVPDANIVEWARKEGSDLIVISIRDRSGLSTVTTVSVGEKIVREAPCPVLSIPARVPETRGQRSAAVA